MKEFARSKGLISMQAEIPGQQLLNGQVCDDIVAGIGPCPCFGRKLSGENGSARWPTGRGNTVGLGEKYPPLSQGIHVGGFCLRMTSQAPDPIIEIIHHDHQYIRLLSPMKLTDSA